MTSRTSSYSYLLLNPFGISTMVFTTSGTRSPIGTRDSTEHLGGGTDVVEGVRLAHPRSPPPGERGGRARQRHERPYRESRSATDRFRSRAPVRTPPPRAARP